MLLMEEEKENQLGFFTCFFNEVETICIVQLGNI